MSSYLEIQLDQQPIELCKLLKVADLVAGGGEAKIVISQGYVLLNGEVEYQKRKKVYHNDVIEFNGEVIQVIINEDLNPDITQTASADKSPQPRKNNDESHNKPAQNKLKGKLQSNNQTTDLSDAQAPQTQRKRKPISF